MPELPEVQTVVDGINEKIKGRIIADFWTDYYSKSYFGKKNIKDPKYFSLFKKENKGSKILKAERRAKNILIFLDNENIIVIHLKMTGHLLFGDYFFSQEENTFLPRGGYISPKELKKNKELSKEIEKNPLRDPFNKFIHFVISFKDGKKLALSDMRKFATIFYLKKNELDNFINEFGPEPFDLNEKEFVFMAKNKRGKIKTVLMNPYFIAGIGNIYSDEILWMTGVHPESEISKVSEKKLIEILKFAKKILKKSINLGGDSMSDFRNIEGRRGGFQKYHNCYKLEGTKCKKDKCNGVLEKKNINGRIGRYCPLHQKKY